MGLLRAWRRQRLMKKPMPPGWREIVAERLPFAAELPGEERMRFDAQLVAFIHEKRFEGRGGLVVTDEMRVVVAGVAVRLTRNLDLRVYDAIESIVLVPTHFERDGHDGVTLGLVHRFGTVVLAWDAVRHGIANDDDGRNTALHEFAHAIDLHDGAFNGTPTLATSVESRAWAAALAPAFLALKERPGSGVLRAYGATNEAEFFAVATEVFFENPERLKKRAPEVYRALARYFRVDPAR